MSIKVLPYRAGSRSARALANALGGRVLRLEGSRYVPRQRDLIINWGNGNPGIPCTKNGNPNLLRRATNKLDFFRAFSETGRLPRFWERAEDIPDDAFPIVCRTVLTGHSGAGIVISESRDNLVRAPLYVQYVKKQSEFRLHLGRVGDDIVTIFEQRKVRREGTEVTNWQVRNHANGFIYQRQGIDVPLVVRSAAIQVFAATGLDFGAVDVIYNARNQQAFVLEINTAPGLEGQSSTDYANFFRRFL